jgi:ABC-2 type transport system permease protein
MTKALAIARRELLSYRRSLLGPVMIAAVLLLEGLLFYFFALRQRLLSSEALERFFWLASGPTLVASVVLGVRLIAEERQSGSFVLLGTSPVSERAIVFGKYAAALTVLALMLFFSAHMPAWLTWHGRISWAHVGVGYLGLFLLGAAGLAVALFASTLTRSQVIAAVTSAVILGGLLLTWVAARVAPPGVALVLSALSLQEENFRPFMAGILEADKVGYYVSLSGFFLLASIKSLEARRWR